METILESLNAAQRAAVTSPASVLQILAPPGSGKTKTLTSRVAYLLSYCDYKPWNILCLTFTIKSAREMKERIAKMITDGSEKKLVLGTFHSVSRRYLVRYGHHIGVPKGFGIADSSDSLAIITRIIKRLQLNIDPRVARARISSSKAKSMGYADMSDSTKRKNLDQQEFVTVFEAYDLHLATSNLLDYDDLLVKCAVLLEKYPACVSNVEAVLVDEFQDTNHVQYRLMQLFSAKNSRITTVGDPDQSIYGWRSAEIKNLKKMRRHYPDTLVIHLEDNYRSSAAILLAALEVIQQDVARHPKPLVATHCPGTPPVLRKLPSAAIEAKWIVTEIQRSMGLTGNLLNYSDYAILFRSAALWLPLESEMGKAGIPYRVVGGQKFFDRAEIKILLDYLRVISQPENSDALARVINEPKRGVGDTSIKALLEEAAAQRRPLWNLIRNGFKVKVSKSAEKGISSLINLVLTARRQMTDSSDVCQPCQLLSFVIKKLEFKEYLEKNHPKDHDDRWANVEELLALASDMSISASASEDADELDDALPESEGQAREPGGLAEEALSRFLANVALSTEKQRDDDLNSEGGPGPTVTISTMHAAKGLEWPVVFIPCTYEGSIPHSRSEDTDEERRVLYVAMTRAQALLYMSYPTNYSGQEHTNLSPFLASKKVAPYLTNRGPSIDSSLVKDLCSILRRDFPSEYNIAHLMESVENVEDNLWPLNGEDNPAEAENRRTQRSEVDLHTTYNHRLHRGRTSSTILQSTNTTYPHATEYTIQKTTMMTEIPGFTTAHSHLQHLQKAEMSGQKRTRATGEESKESSKTGPKVKKLDKNQGTISSMWKLHSTAKTTDDGLPPEAVRESELPAHFLNDALRRESAPIFFRTTKPTSSSSIPPELASRALIPIQNVFRPPRPQLSSVHSTKGYPQFSSSPPPAETEKENVPKETDTAPYPYQAAAPSTATCAPFRPSSTYHNTTLAQLQNSRLQPSSSAPKRALGMRRDVEGRKPGGFRIPSMINR